jgi:hypothetical protein
MIISHLDATTWHVFTNPRKFEGLYSLTTGLCVVPLVERPQQLWVKGDENGTCKIDFQLSMFPVWKAHLKNWIFSY